MTLDQDVSIGIALQIVGVVVTAATAVIAGLLRRSIGDLDAKLAEVSRDVKEIRIETGEHAQQLARGDQRMGDIERRIEDLKSQLSEHLRDDRALRS